MGVKDRQKRARKAAAKAEETPPALLGQNPDLIMATIIDIFHKVGHRGSALWSSLLLHELLPGSELVDGYGIIDDRLSFFNIWVKFEGEDYDPGTAILRVLNASFTEPVVLASEPKGPRVDEEDDAGNRRSLAEYQEDPAKWWKQAPGGLSRIRKFLRK